MSHRGFVAYELKGESLDAAVELDLLVRAHVAANIVDVNGKSLLEAHRVYKAIYEDALAQIGKTHPQLLEKCGLNAPAVQVQDYDGGYPRTYESFPSVYWTSSKLALYLMYCPVDYKGRHFVPADAVKCDDKDFASTDMGHGIYKNHFWIAEGPVVDGGRRGLPLPADFDPATAVTTKASGLRPDRLFVAAGESLYAAVRLQQQEELFKATFNAFTDAAQAWVKKHYPGHYANFSLRRNGHDNALEISVRTDGTGAPVELNHPDWTIDRQLTRHWRNPVTDEMELVVLKEYEARPNPASADGQALYDLFKAIPPHPRASDYPELSAHANGEERSPVVHRYPQGTFLAYHNIQPGDAVTGPRDGRAADAAALIWLDADRNDRQWGIAPPPPPAPLAGLYGPQKTDGTASRGPQPR
jgi:hypothetical protein